MSLPTTRRERRRTAAAAPAPTLAPPRLALLTLTLLGAAGLSGANAKAAAPAAPAGAAAAPTAASTMELVDAAGKLASASEITSLLSGFGGKPMNVVGVLGSKGTGKSTFLNQAFGTSFAVGGLVGQGAMTGVSAATCDGMLLLDCDGVEEGADPTAAFKGTTAGQATAFSTALSDVLLVNLWRSDLGRSVASNVRTVKTLFSEKLQEMAGLPGAGAVGGGAEKNDLEVDVAAAAAAAAASFKRTPVLVAVHDCDPGGDVDALEIAVMEEMSAVWREVDHPSGASLQECFDIQVVAIPHPRYHAVAYATAIEALKEKLQLMEASTAITGFRDKITKAWQAVRDAGTTMIPAKSEMVALFKVDAAYGEVMGSADGQLKSWRQTVGAGRIVPDFGERATKLYRSSMKAFDTKTVRFSTSSTRAKKRAALLSAMEAGIKELYARQLSMLCARALKGYKAALVKLLDGDMLGEDSEANVLRQTLFSFEADATELVPDVFSLGFEDEYEELEADLQEFSEKFTDSPAAQAKAIQKVDTKVQKPKGERSVGFGLGLVGMVRQDGYGNLQGFTGYRAGPHTITIGYANDASLADAGGGGDGKVPLLRLQPKLNIDIDL